MEHGGATTGSFGWVIDHVAASDCERIGVGLLAQPVNTVSSLAYCVVGGWIWTQAAAAPDPRPWRLLGATSAFVGLGSAAYHGPGGQLSHLAHDGGIVLLFPAAALAVATERRPARPRLRLFAALGLGAGVLVHGLSRTGGPLCRPDSLVQGHAAWHALGAAALMGLAAAYLADEEAPAELATTSP